MNWLAEAELVIAVFCLSTSKQLKRNSPALFFRNCLAIEGVIRNTDELYHRDKAAHVCPLPDDAKFSSGAGAALVRGLQCPCSAVHAERHPYTLRCVPLAPPQSFTWTIGCGKTTGIVVDVGTAFASTTAVCQARLVPVPRRRDPATSDARTLAAIVARTVHASPLQLRRTLGENVVLGGARSVQPGLVEALSAQLASQLHTQVTCSVAGPNAGV